MFKRSIGLYVQDILESVDNDILWKTIKDDLPEFKKRILEIKDGLLG